MMACRPDPKPIRTGTLYSLCVTHRLMRIFKLVVRVYGGTEDEDFSNTKHKDTLNL